MRATSDGSEIYQLKPKDKTIYSAFFVFKILVLLLVIVEGALIFKKLLFYPHFSGFLVLFLTAEILIISATLLGIYLMIPRYGNHISPLKALTYKVILNPETVAIKESNWAPEFSIKINDLVAIIYGGYLVFRGENLNPKFILSKDSKIKYIKPEDISDITEQHPGQELYIYRLNLAFIDNYQGLKEKLTAINAEIKVYDIEFDWEEEKEDEWEQND